MRSKQITIDFYSKMGFTVFEDVNYSEYLMLKLGKSELHFFLFEGLNPEENYDQIYLRCTSIEDVYADFISNHVPIHPAGRLQQKPWGLKEFSVLDPDKNLLTFGETI